MERDSLASAMCDKFGSTVLQSRMLIMPIEVSLIYMWLQYLQTIIVIS
jgi:hypothetical protein